MNDGLAGLKALQRASLSAGDDDAIAELFDTGDDELRLPAEYLLVAGHKP